MRSVANCAAVLFIAQTHTFVIGMLDHMQLYKNVVQHDAAVWLNGHMPEHGDNQSNFVLPPTHAGMMLDTAK